MSPMPYRFLDHTGDFAIELEAADAPEAYGLATRALLHLLTDAPETVRETTTRDIALEGVDPTDLLITLGNELLFLFEVEGFLAARLDVEHCDDDTLEGTLHGAPYDPAHHPIARPAKAVTHHDARFEAREGGVHARFVVDL
ncbi:MAG TPA: archease [Polyangiaceae bacterium LLY-WYZ-15_(1-7)]|nr:hypothetical protein [Sandaracinus sp.]HJK91587.1 archease [Polyangiaceae bacterium LLY-WYZ-15_(1-7)]MBJ70053.1 hypothetical protein [Sandaracinus sp.]HJL02339.1 archease [Polyangiaceae bacterium LLY-WYZ-15_(1-7)]HJL12499.1 archease [Polyangiaceae bacterium LLY-WYZ-15_(1-7)]